MRKLDDIVERGQCRLAVLDIELRIACQIFRQTCFGLVACFLKLILRALKRSKTKRIFASSAMCVSVSDGLLRGSEGIQLSGTIREIKTGDVICITIAR